MDVFEDALINKINSINHEHDTFWRTFLFTQENNLSKDDIKRSNIAENYLEYLNNGTIESKHGTKYKNILFRMPRSSSNELDPTAIYMERTEKTRTCQNMNGVLGKHIMYQSFY